MPNDTISQMHSLLEKLRKERDHHQAAIDEIDAIFERLGAGPARASRRGRPAKGRGRRMGKRPGGQRVQGVKQALLDSLSDKPQSPGELAAKVSKRVGAKVSITTQLHMLKADGHAKSPARGQWVRG